MNQPAREIQQYIERVANYLRTKEADMLRGQPEMLQQLDQTTDLDLLKKWSWKTAIVTALITFFGMPFSLLILRLVLPQVLLHIYFVLILLGMGLACLMFGLAVYLTFFAATDNGG